MEINEKAIQKIREDFDKMIDDLNEDKIEMFKREERIKIGFRRLLLVLKRNRGSVYWK